VPTPDAIRWFKTQFETKIQTAVAGTPFSVDMLTAIACQETGLTWNALRKQGLPTAQILALCVGDTIDAPGRAAFPTNKAALLAEPNGQAMFDLARQALVDMAAHIPSYQPSAAKPNKFCHGFGIFQYDLQFFKTDPQYFLQKRYADFDASLAKAIGELQAKLKRLGWQAKTTLTDYEMAAVAIAYNTGGFKPDKGLKQGYYDGTRYYGEAVFDYLRLAHTVPADGTAAPPAPPPGTTVLPVAAPVSATGTTYTLKVLATVLNVRSAPEIPADKPTSNVIATLPDGHAVRAVTDQKKNGFLEIETSLNGALLRGFVSAKYLSAGGPAVITTEQPAAANPTTGVTAVYMPRAPGSVTRRTDPASAQSLNEAGQPQRAGDTAEARRASLAALIDWLDVQEPTHVRYQPRDGKTFCNIYAHDYCHLAQCYLPRVWWTAPAIVALSQGQAVEPQYEKTITEVRANDLFRWLRDWGLRFGWRQSTSLDELQLEANQGAIGLIVARRTDEGRPGHITMVVPETETQRARRNAAGQVVAALQSQAGSTNFNYGTAKLDWYKAAQFAEFSFWLHA